MERDVLRSAKQRSARQSRLQFFTRIFATMQSEAASRDSPKGLNKLRRAAGISQDRGWSFAVKQAHPVAVIVSCRDAKRCKVNRCYNSIPALGLRTLTLANVDLVWRKASLLGCLDQIVRQELASLMEVVSESL